MTVVIIDDAQINVSLLQHLVRKLPDCEPIGFTDPMVALDWCLNNDPDLVIVDYMMPQLDGIGLTQRFRERYPDSPVLMVTANIIADVRHQALQSGVTDFLNKPINNVEFLARARNMLSLRKSHKRLEDQAATLAEEVRLATQKIVEQEHETIFCLAKAAEYRDPETGDHIRRMAHISRHIARILGLAKHQQDLLLEAAPMHDIGKVGTPDAILLKPARLTPEEFEIMKQHTMIGYQVLSTSHSPLMQTAAEIAWTHHEKFDGSGYPRGMKGESIPLFGRIVAVADVFDALTSDRPYKQAWEVEPTLRLIKGSIGSHFDPVCVEAFLADFDAVLAIKSRFVEGTSAAAEP
jgi:putative two-component system response regulator